MPRYVAFLRGVSPLNARMPELRQSFEAAGFTDVKTVLASGNVVFDSRSSSVKVLERRAVDAMQAGLGRSFRTIVRPVSHLRQLVEPDPFAGIDLPSKAKRVITFLGSAVDVRVELPVERDGARILKRVGAEVYTAYVPSDKGPVFMQLLERTFGTDITTRTLDTVRKCAAA